MYVETFSARLKKARIDAQLYQVDVQEQTGINRATLSNYETGRTQPDIETLCILLDLYKADANWVLGTGKY